MAKTRFNQFVFLFILSISKSQDCQIVFTIPSTTYAFQRSRMHVNSSCQLWFIPKHNQMLLLTIHKLQISTENRCKATCTDMTCKCNYWALSGHLLIHSGTGQELLCFCKSVEKYFPLSIKSTEPLFLTTRNFNASYADISYEFYESECGDGHITQSPGIIFSKDESPSPTVTKSSFHFVKCTWIIHSYHGNHISLDIAALQSGNCRSFNISVSPLTSMTTVNSTFIFCSGNPRINITIPGGHPATSLKLSTVGFKHIKYKIGWELIDPNSTEIPSKGSSTRISSPFLFLQMITTVIIIKHKS